MSDQKSKVSLTLDVGVKGLKQLTSTTDATDNLNKSLEGNRTQVASLSAQLKKVEGYQATEVAIAKTNEKLEQAKQKHQGLNQQVNESRQAQNQLKKAFDDSERQLTNLQKKLADPKGYKLSQSEMKGLGVELAQTELRMSRLSDEMHENSLKTNMLRRSQRGAEKQIDRYSTSAGKQSDKLNKLQRELRQSGISTDNLSSEQQRLKSATERATQSLEKQGKQLKELGSIQSRIDNRNAKLGDLKSQATSLAMMGAPVAGSMWAAMKNESSFADVKKVVDMSPEQASQMQSWSLKQSGNMPMSANEINAMLAAGGQSGIKDTGELKKFVLDSAMMGVAFDMEAGEAGTTLANFKASLGLDQQGALELAGMSNFLSSQSNSKAKDIAAVMAREGVTAKASGFQNNETAALTASLLSTGMAEERVATAVKNISGRLSLGTAASGTQQKALSSLGLDAQTVASDMHQDASGTLLDVLDAITSAPVEEQSAYFSQIFGEEAKGAVAALAGNTSEFTRILGLANQGQDVHIKSLKDEYAARIATSENGVEQFTNKLMRLTIIVGQKLLTALNWVLEPLGNVVEHVADFAEASDVLVPALAIGLGGLVALKTAMIAGKAASLLFGNTLDKSRLFRKKLNVETNESGKAAAFATRQISRLNKTMMSMGSEGGGSRHSRRGVKSRVGKRRSRNPLGRAKSFGSALLKPSEGALPLSLIGGGLALMPSIAAAQDVIGAGGDIAQGAGKLGLGNFLRPLDTAISAGNIMQSAVNGDVKGAASSTGEFAGGLAGAKLGASLGAFGGPIGVIAGGLLGSIAGSMGGEMLGDWFGEKLMSGDELRTQVAQKEQQQSQAQQATSVQFSPVIQITPSKGMDDAAIAQQVVKQMDDQFSYLMGGHSVEQRFNYASIDRG
ncbi:phage tail tape measure protein [Vibrio splendidus]|uniref:phage tail tape measure protein n=1 Tax=Vibrio splendidus TaxID=29497 RepID=UPI000C82FB8F|nr:phage tail tape measure protein [Vibrio splendidus]PMI49578.1 phage tail tape measure protein [Vibrio splendidus]